LNNFKLSESKLFLYSLILFIILVSLFNVIKTHNGYILPSGKESYFHLKASEDFSLNSILYDKPILKNYNINPYHFLLGFFIDNFSLDFTFKYFQAFLGFLSIIFFLLLLKDLGLDIQKRFFLITFFILSPAFLYVVFLFVPESLSLLFGFLGFYLYLKKNKFVAFIGSILLLILPLFGSVELILLIALFLGLFYFRSDIKSLVMIILIVFVYLINFGVRLIIFVSPNFLQSSFTDFGGFIGFGIFYFFLAAIGLIFTWRYKKQHIILYLLIIFFIVSVRYFGFSVNVYLNIIFAYLASLSFSRLVNRKWDSQIIKTFTVLVLIFGIMFSSLSYINRVSVSGPNEGVLKSLLWLNQKSDSSDVVLSAKSKGFWIEYFSSRDALIDGFTLDYSLISDVDIVFDSRNLEITKSILDKHQVDFIWIDIDMKNGEVWSKDEEGLLFLFKDKSAFRQVYNDLGVEIWNFRR